MEIMYIQNILDYPYNPRDFFFQRKIRIEFVKLILKFSFFFIFKFR